MEYIIGNWKMNKTLDESISFVQKLDLDVKNLNLKKNLNIFISPPSIFLPSLSQLDNSIQFMGQNIAFEDSGALTGELSANMLSQYVNHIIIGHSERRLYFHENDKILYNKLKLCFNYGMVPVFCVGENKEDRDSGNYLRVIEKQLENTIMLFANSELCNIIVAYEPIWAIGTGIIPSYNQIQEVHTYIRNLLKSKQGDCILSDIPVLYGGSCTSKNAKLILQLQNVNGLLIGGASLDLLHFEEIISIANEISS
ncbi:MAG: triose-phosphate isomerase [Flavobacteriales bacterium]|nr:triose-phosphate isomerase [Flavobacteriales bacterium]|tara:strand:+ start:18525 stop:19286 length:762 start_codon:yes stop_codon:yes gene_type:complete